jgi:hypothetical protein
VATREGEMAEDKKQPGRSYEDKTETEWKCILLSDDESNAILQALSHELNRKQKQAA